MATWQKICTDVTIAYDAQQGREFILSSWSNPFRLIAYHKEGVRRTIGIWGKDSLNRDIIIYNGSYADGQEFMIAAEYNNVHIAVNLTPDIEPKKKRWYIQGQYYRQAYHYAKVDVEVYCYK